jgi:hypothetical protein
VEAKLSATTIEPSLIYFRDRLRIPWVYQVVLEGKRDFVQNGIRCVPARQFLDGLAEGTNIFQSGSRSATWEFHRSDKAGAVSLIEQVNLGNDVPQSRYH